MVKLDLPKEILTLFDEVIQHNFLVGIVGGFCRDFLLSATQSRDIDLEIRPKGEISTTELYSFLQKKYTAKIQKTYNILTIDFGEYSVEMGLPRVESFNDKVGHSNFDVEFISDLDFSMGYKRRDFTINAILFLYKDKQWKIIDPLEGVADLKNRMLVECDQNSFSKDPVRALRALRFSIRLNFKLNTYLTKLLKSFDPSTVTSHYLKLEAKKSESPIVFLSALFNLTCLVKVSDKFYEDVEVLVKIDPRLTYDDKLFLIEKLGYSKKGISKLELCKNINDLVHSIPEQLEKDLIILEKANLSTEYLSFVLNSYFLNFDYQQFKTFQTSQYELTSEDKKSDPKSYRFIVLKKRLEMSC